MAAALKKLHNETVPLDIKDELSSGLISAAIHGETEFLRPIEPGTWATQTQTIAVCLRELAGLRQRCASPERAPGHWQALRAGAKRLIPVLCLVSCWFWGTWGGPCALTDSLLWGMAPTRIPACRRASSPCSSAHTVPGQVLAWVWGSAGERGGGGRPMGSAGPGDLAWWISSGSGTATPNLHSCSLSLHPGTQPSCFHLQRQD